MSDINRKLTIVTLGHFVTNFTMYIDYLLYSLKDNLEDLRQFNWIFYYDNRDEKEHKEEREALQKVLDKYNLYNARIEWLKGGTVAVAYKIIYVIDTPYVFFIEHDWIFLKNNIDVKGVINTFDKHDFVNKIVFKKDGNAKSLLWSYNDGFKNTIPFEREERVDDIDIIQCCYWSNNPHFIRTSCLKKFHDDIFPENVHEKVKNNKLWAQAYGYEEPIIRRYKSEVANNKWEDIKDVWGTFIYGVLDESTYLAHADGSKRYNGEPERLGREWINNVYKENL